MKLFSIDSPLMQALSKAADLMLLNLMFLAFSIPLFTIGASVTALYRVLISRSAGDESSVVRSFYNAFKANFKLATITELVLLLPFGLVLFDLYLLSTGAVDTSVIGVWLCLLPAAIFALFISYIFPLIAQFENTVGQTIKNAAVLAAANFPISVLVAALNLTPVILLAINREFFLKTVIIWILIGFAIVAWINEKLLHRVFKQFIPPKQ